MSGKQRQTQKPLYSETENSSTEVSPLALALRQRMASSASLGGQGLEQEAGAEAAAGTHDYPLPGVLGSSQRPAATATPVSPAYAESSELDPLANLLAPTAPPDPDPKTSSKMLRISKELTIPLPTEQPLWVWAICGALALSLGINVICLLSLRSSAAELKASRARMVTGAVITQTAAAAPELQSTPGCTRDSTQTISGKERDQLLADVVTVYEMGRRPEALTLLKRYIKEACDTATVQAAAILERELNPPKKDPAK